MSGLIIIPQIIVAILAPWVGYHSEARGRRSLLLLGFGLEPVRATLLAFTASYPFAIVAQVLDGISAAIITVLTVLVVTDLTTGTGRFNLARGTVGAMSSIAASVSTIATGFITQHFGHIAGFLFIAAVATARRHCSGCSTQKPSQRNTWTRWPNNRAWRVRRRLRPASWKQYPLW